MEQILLCIEEPVIFRRLLQAGEEISLRERLRQLFFRRCRLLMDLRRDRRLLHSLCLAYGTGIPPVSSRRIRLFARSADAKALHQIIERPLRHLLTRLMDRLFLLRLIREGIHRDPAVLQEVCIPRHRLQIQPKIRQKYLRYEPERALRAAKDVRGQLRILSVHHRIPQLAAVLHTEIRSALPDHAGIEGLIIQRRKDHPRPDLILIIARRRHNETRRHIIIPVTLRQPRQRPIRQQMMTELIDIPIKDRRLLRAESRHRIIIPVLLHEGRPLLLHHIIQHKVPVIAE